MSTIFIVSTLTRHDALEQVEESADIAVTVGADVLSGATDGFGISADGQWVVPAAWVAELAASVSPFWHRLVLDPVMHDVLSHEYLGRFAPDILSKALLFRDGVCQSPGCLKPADQCDDDHREPWPEGSTSGANMWPFVPQTPHPQGTSGPEMGAAQRAYGRRRTEPPRPAVRAGVHARASPRHPDVQYELVSAN